jgi:YD repeat-containing protein
MNNCRGSGSLLVQLGLLVVLLVLAGGILAPYFWNRTTDRQEAERQALQQLQASLHVTNSLGTPVTVQGVTGQVRADEAGRQEVRLSLALRGPRSEGLAEVVGARSTGPWTFTTLEVFLAREDKRIDVLAGRVVEIVEAIAPAARRSGDYPCVSTAAAFGSAPRIGDCTPPVPIAALEAGSVDRFDLDLRTGKFVLRQTDLLLTDGALQVPLTRTYTSQLWTSRDNAFGGNSTHDFDIAPVGRRNPYSFLHIVLPDGDFLYCPRISRGTGYADAVYRHSETASRFYKAVTRWDGTGWVTRLDDGSRLHFPEAYEARTMAQGAPTEMTDARGNTLRLIRGPLGILQEIRTPSGRSIRLEHDGGGRVVRAADDEGRSVDYRYSPAGLLSEVRYPGGRARHYTYAGDLLITVRDEAGQVLIHNEYEGPRVVRQDYSNGASHAMRYTMADSDEYATEATVVLPGGATRSFRTWDAAPEVIKDRR